VSSGTCSVSTASSAAVNPLITPSSAITIPVTLFVAQIHGTTFLMSAATNAVGEPRSWGGRPTATGTRSPRQKRMRGKVVGRYGTRGVAAYNAVPNLIRWGGRGTRTQRKKVKCRSSGRTGRGTECSPKRKEPCPPSFHQNTHATQGVRKCVRVAPRGVGVEGPAVRCVRVVGNPACACRP